MKKQNPLKTFVLSIAAAVASMTLTISSASGQEASGSASGEATIYRDGGYRGPAVYTNAAKPNLGLAWPVNSIRVRSGRWQLCEKPRYRGTCRTVDSDTPLLGSLLRGVTVQSMRPDVGSGSGFGVEARDQVTRGVFAEFHTQPGVRGFRIPSCPSGQSTANCAATTADNYCRSIGWNGSAREFQETVGRGVFLADVLCVKSGYQTGEN